MRMTATVLCTLLLGASTASAQSTLQTPASFQNQNLTVPAGPANANASAPPPVAQGVTTLPAIEPRSGEAIVRDTVQRDTIAIPGLVTNAPPAAPPSLVPGPIAQGPTPPPVRPFPVEAQIAPSTIAGTTGLVPSTTAGMTGLTPSTIAGTSGLVPSTTGGMSPLFRPAVVGAPLIVPPGVTMNTTTSFGAPSTTFGVPIGAPAPSFVTGDPRLGNTNAR
jgi:hypothetical protein